MIHRHYDEPLERAMWRKNAVSGIIEISDRRHAMDQKLTPDKLNGLPKEALILLIMSMQDQLTALNSRLDDLTEQIRVANNQRFGRSTEKLEQFSGQGFFDPDGNLYFNETEAILDRSGEPAEPTFEEASRRRTLRQKGKKRI